MAREIKFRAWGHPDVYDTEPRRMLTWEEVRPISMLALGRFDQFEWMQFTGIKDKNGVEIYEGDIGRINLLDIGYVNCVCNWNLAGFRWKKINEMQGISANPSTSWSLCVDSFEVIGNIYEHPDLLN